MGHSPWQGCRRVGRDLDTTQQQRILIIRDLDPMRQKLHDFLVLQEATLHPDLLCPVGFSVPRAPDFQACNPLCPSVSCFLQL